VEDCNSKALSEDSQGEMRKKSARHIVLVDIGVQANNLNNFFIFQLYGKCKFVYTLKLPEIKTTTSSTLEKCSRVLNLTMG
jgi:MinD superfamily P-loop ATPase